MPKTARFEKFFPAQVLAKIIFFRPIVRVQCGNFESIFRWLRYCCSGKTIAEIHDLSAAFRGQTMKIDVEGLLGNNWKRLLAHALACTSERFNNPLSSRVLAVVELVESVRAFDPKLLPDRWNASQPVSDDEEVQPPNLRDRFARLFGADALVPRLSVAIGMAQETIVNAFRGRSLRAQSDLVAVIELLEILYGPEGSEKNWPPRWLQINSVEERRRSTRRLPDTDFPDPLEMKARVAAVLGGKNSSAIFARALGKSPDSLSRIWRSELDSNGRSARVQPALAAVIELLETLRAEGIPIERWPRRWQEHGPRLGRPPRSN